MTQALSSVRFLHSGWCGQYARLVGAPSWTWIRFYAVFVYFEHPVHGGCLVDTAYSDEFFRATRWLPQRLYRWLTPVQLEDPSNARDQLSAAGIDPSSIRRVFVSHFHADHIAGLKLFPEAQFVIRQEAYDRLLRQSTFSQVRHGVLGELFPPDFRSRCQELTEDLFTTGEGDWKEFRVCDFWGDGSLLLVDLPGHADGHYGFVLQTVQKRIFYIVDACWHVQVLLDKSPLPWISRRFQHDETAYFQTQEKLRKLTQQTGLELLACHCPKTLNHVS